ncbi:sulfite exporter TauE/SafE family protein [Pusillimonas sp. CC-YST705]|uniref:Probable membrane transporter protein n=1 Tax=Mesopusillimonas faecipullorum TaxID=2755040 RepID=A0ABS8CE25_9BURK|nr:sulfite exporter TauE/SafE family protein [Mesopusillimonas faecipullorum]MCB5364082.1 sulfite exporter TauE/SafE family protein [Mesopusillimonas faecipullorum]
MDALLAHGSVWLLSACLALLASGLLAGVLAGLLGIGGGIVIVPILYYIFRLLHVDPSVLMHVVVGTSLATIVPTSIMSSRAHRKSGNLDMAVVKRLLPGVLIGVLIGALTSRYLAGEWLTGIFATMAMLIAIKMAFDFKAANLGATLPSRFVTGLFGCFIGGVSTLIGVGGGTLSVPILSSFNIPMRIAVGTSALVGVFISIPGTLAFMINGWGASALPPLSVGYVNLLSWILIVPASMLSTAWGAALTSRINARYLQYVFAAFLVATSIHMFYGLIK